MKKILCILLCLAMAFAGVALLSSCKKGNDAEPKVGKESVTVNLADYTLVMGEELTSGTQNRVNSFASDLSLRAQRDEETEPVETEDLEILVGQTNRKETVKTLKKLGDCGWAVRVTDNKLVIVGTSSLMTRAAVDYVTENYLDGIKEGKLTLPTEITFAKVGVGSFTNEDGTGQYTLVYGDNVDDVNNGGAYNYATDKDPTGGAAVDYIYTVATEIRDSISKGTEAGRDTFPMLPVSESKAELEIVVGSVPRADVRAELLKLAVDQCGLFIRNGKIMILAWNDTVLPQAYNIFKDLLEETLDEEGNKTFPANCTLIETVKTDWVVDFPKPDGLTPDGTVDVGDSSVEYIYAGDGVSADAYKAYRQKLEAAGYTAVGTANDNPYGTENMFADYVNHEEGIALHVYYTPYQYAAAQQVTDILASIRVVATSLENKLISLPDSEMLKAAQSYDKVTDSMITTLNHDYNAESWGLSNIITLEDGSFLIFDGGAGLGGSVKDGAGHMYNVLTALYTKVFGSEPTAQKPIRIRAWMLTHEHMDHYTVMKNFIDQYGPQNTVRIERVLFNAVSNSEAFNAGGNDQTFRNNMQTLQNRSGFKYIKVHTGQVFHFANCKVEIMGTHEDLYPKNLYFFNDSSTTYKTTLTSGNTTFSCNWYGDLERMGSRRLRAMWGEHLKVDAVQVSHHTFNGVEPELYQLNAPKYVIVPYKNSWGTKVNNWANDGYFANRAAHWLSCVNPNRELIVFADEHDYTLIIGTNGPKMDEVFDAITGEVVEPNGNSLISFND